MRGLEAAQLYKTQWGDFWAMPQDLIGGLTLPGNLWDLGFLQPYFDRVGPDETVIDVGANIGLHSIYLSRRAKLVFAVEPVEGTYSLLTRNIQENKAFNVVAARIAAYSEPCSLALAPEEVQGQPLYGMDFSRISNIGGLSLIMDERGEFDGLPLDDYQFMFKGRVSLIKVDAQGCDLRALVGLLGTIMAHRPTIVFEFEEGLSLLHGDTWQDYLSFFASADYRLEPTQNRANWAAFPKEEKNG